MTIDQQGKLGRLQDKYALIRDFFEEVNKKNGLMRYPTVYLAIDETLYPYRGRLGFKIYLQNKPAKFGLLYRSLCDASLPYTYYTLPYAGKPEDLQDNEYKKYYVTGTDNYSIYLIEELSKINSIQGCNISVDRFFTSVPLARWATLHKITIIGTMRLDRKGITKELKTLEGREEKSTIYMYGQDKGDENTMFVSYIDKKKTGKKNVVVLTTMHDTVRVTKDTIRKPDVIKLYDHTIGGVDVVDLISSGSSTRIKIRRWTMNALAFILDTERTNTLTILREVKDPKMSNFNFTWELGKNLVIPHMF